MLRTVIYCLHETQVPEAEGGLMEALFYFCGACALIVVIGGAAGGKGALQMILLMIPVTVIVWFVAQALEGPDSYRPRHEEYPMAWRGR